MAQPDRTVRTFPVLSNRPAGHTSDDRLAKFLARFDLKLRWPWRRAEINDAIDRVDRVDGTSDFHFATETFTSRRGSHGTMLCSIKNVPQMEAMALDAAFRRLTEYSAAN